MSATSQAAPAANLNLMVSSAILMDAGSGQVLYEMNADEARPPASMSKMMTEYIALEKIKAGQLKLDDTVTVSDYAASAQGSGQLLAAGEQIRIDDLFYAIAVGSANDAAICLAEKISGSEKAFANLMNETAKKIGLSDKAHFVNASGLEHVDFPPKYRSEMLDGETMLTARDTAILASRLINDHPEILKYSKTVSKKLRPTDKTPMDNWNWMLEGKSATAFQKQYAYPGMDGLKTGHTDKAGWCFTGTAERNGIRLISVVMNAGTEQKHRFTETKKLLDYGFNNFEKKQVVKKGDTIDTLKTVKVSKGVDLSVPVVADTDLSLLALKGAKDSEFVKSAKASVTTLTAPVMKGTEVGTLTVKYNGTEKTVKLVAANDVKKASWFKLFFRAIGDFFSGLGSKIKKLF
jgi:D-alanyl-D-alanine carboxypeptidase (penicillin-binding protein 5/6)